MTKSIIISHNEGQTSTANSTQHFSLGGARGTAGFWDVTHTEITWRDTGTLSNLRIYVSVESLAANATFRTKKNGANGSQSVVFQTTGAFEDTTNTDSVTSGDKFTLEAVGPASGTFLFTMAQCYFDYGSAGARNLLSPADQTIDLASATRYQAIGGQPNADWNASEDTFVKARQRKSMLFENFGINRLDNTRTTTTTFTTRKNAAAGNQSIAFTTGTGIIEDNINSDGVIAGDDFNYRVVTSTGIQALRFWPSIFVGANSASISEYFKGGAIGAARLGNAVDSYESIVGTLPGTAITTEANTQAKVPDSVVWSELTVTITANSMDSGETNLFTFRKNSAATSMAISNTFGQTGVLSDSTNTAATVVNDLVCTQVNPAGAATDSVTIASIIVWGTIDTSQDITRAVPTETITLSDSRARLAAKIRTRTDTAIAVSETRARLSAKNRPITTQTTALSENIIRIKGKVKSLATETITVGRGTLTELLAKIRTRSETVVIAEARNRIAAKNRALSLQTTTVGAGSIAEIKGAVKTISQTTIIGENLARLSTKIRALALQTITIGAGTAARLSAKIRALSTQTVTLSENVARIKSKLKSLATETVTVAAGGIARLAAKTRITSQTIIISETPARLKASMRSLALQTITLGENLARLLSKIRVISQTVVIGESITRLTAKIRALAAQTVAIAEDLQRTLTAGAQNIVKTITQTITLGESIVRLKASQRLTSQTIIIGTGSIARLAAKIRAIPQTILLTDNRVRLAAKNRLLAIQTVSLGEDIARIKGILRTISQSVLLNENITKLSAKIRALSLQITAIADSVARQVIGGPVEIIRSLTQTVVLSDSLNRLSAVQRILSQTVLLAENLARVRGVLRTLSQSIPVLESLLRTKSALRLISQTITTSDSINRLNTLTRTLSQTILTAENVAQETVGNLIRSLVETVTVSDSIVRRTAKLVILDQFIIIAEQASRLSTKLRTIPAQTISLSDLAIAEVNVIIKNVVKVISNIIGLTEHLQAYVIKVRDRFRYIREPSQKHPRMISNHPAWLVGSRGMHDNFEEFDG